MIIIIIFYFTTSCNSQGKEVNEKIKNNIERTATNIKNKDSIIDKMNKVLTRQIQFGNSVSNDVTDIKYYEFSVDDIEVLEDECSKILLSNGYIAPTEEIFNKHINKIFNKLHNNKNLFYINTFDICKGVSSFADSDGFRPNVFISKTKKLIVDQLFIAEITDYEELYPPIIDIEKKINTKFKDNNGDNVYVTRWKDVKDLAGQRKRNIQILVARNMYLFNDSRAHFKWLLLNDKNFMQSLVTTFGYYDDKELLKWVVENTKFDSNNPNELDKIFWNKKCDGTVKLNLEIFTVLKEIIKPEGTNYFEALKMYVMYLLEDKDKRNELSLQDRAKLLAHLVYFGEQYRYDEKYKDKSYFMQRIWMRDIDDSIKKEIIKNNYYNLPGYKNLYVKSEEYQNALADENGG
ncbi:hypothetical protein [Flavobacterium sp. 140616W15]|uniref:hypothetical protein n=1 Tax=Flavobacterium sp. 140616W15 TaxID=2478552 RepID=UPI001013C9EA|nr:hypothetical protein [Flavobacterium sp. 140616W15]